MIKNQILIIVSTISSMQSITFFSTQLLIFSAPFSVWTASSAISSSTRAYSSAWASSPARTYSSDPSSASECPWRTACSTSWDHPSSAPRTLVRKQCSRMLRPECPNHSSPPTHWCISHQDLSSVSSMRFQQPISVLVCLGLVLRVLLARLWAALRSFGISVSHRIQITCQW